MTDPNRPDPNRSGVPGRRPDQPEEAVRALLRDARATGPIPPEVAARLDETLRSLEAERGSGGSTGPAIDADPTTIRSLPDPPPTVPRPRSGQWPVSDTAPRQRRTDAPAQDPGRALGQPAGQGPGSPTPPFPGVGPGSSEHPDGRPGDQPVDLASRRRRRLGVGLLAAAATVAAAVGIGSLISTDADLGAGSGADSSEVESDGGANDEGLAQAPNTNPSAVPMIRSESFRSDVRQVWPELRSLQRGSTSGRLVGCAGAETADYAFPVDYQDADGATVHAALLADEITDGTFEVTLYDCATSTDLRTVQMQLD